MKKKTQFWCSFKTAAKKTKFNFEFDKDSTFWARRHSISVSPPEGARTHADWNIKREATKKNERHKSSPGRLSQTAERHQTLRHFLNLLKVHVDKKI